MKKLMIAMAIVAMGVAAHAAVVDWQYKVTASPVNYNSGYTLYLVDAANWDKATISADTFTDSSIVYGSTTFAAGTGKSATSKTYASIAVGTTDAGISSTTLADSIITDGGTHDFYYVILDTNAEPNQYYVSEKATLTGRAGNGSSVTANVFDATNASIQAAGWTAVPEPTSGLLVLLGMAGLALKRKRA